GFAVVLAVCDGNRADSHAVRLPETEPPYAGAEQTELDVLWLRYLAARRGEILHLPIEDVAPGTGAIDVVRSAGSPFRVLRGLRRFRGDPERRVRIACPGDLEREVHGALERSRARGRLQRGQRNGGRRLDLQLQAVRRERAAEHSGTDGKWVNSR